MLVEFDIIVFKDKCITLIGESDISKNAVWQGFFCFTVFFISWFFTLDLHIILNFIILLNNI